MRSSPPARTGIPGRRQQYLRQSTAGPRNLTRQEAAFSFAQLGTRHNGASQLLAWTGCASTGTASRATPDQRLATLHAEADPPQAALRGSTLTALSFLGAMAIRSRGMAAFQGTFFSTKVPMLVSAVCDLDESVPRRFANGSAAARLVLLQDTGMGRGVVLAPGIRVSKGDIVAVYYGEIAVDYPAGDYSLGIGQFRVAGRSLDLSIDAIVPCRHSSPDVANAALLPCSNGAVGAATNWRAD